MVKLAGPVILRAIPPGGLLTAPPTRSDRVVHELRDGILRGTWKAGDRLPGEREIAARLGIHRSSVREALKKLEQLRLVAIRPGGRATVSPLEGASVEILRHLLFAGGALDVVLAEQLLDFREMLTVGAARLALERGSDEDLAEARSLLGRLGLRGVTVDEHLATLERLFALMVRASGNLVLALVRNGLLGPGGSALGESRRRLGQAMGTSGVAAIVAAIDQAIARRDAEALEAAVRRLVRTSRPLVLESLSAAAPAAAPASAG